MKAQLLNSHVYLFLLKCFSFVFVLICFLLTDHPVFIHARKIHSDQRKQKMG